MQSYLGRRNLPAATALVVSTTRANPVTDTTHTAHRRVFCVTNLYIHQRDPITSTCGRPCTGAVHTTLLSRGNLYKQCHPGTVFIVFRAIAALMLLIFRSCCSFA